MGRTLANAGLAGIVADVDGTATARSAAEDEHVVPQQARPRSAPIQKTKPTGGCSRATSLRPVRRGQRATRKFCSRCGTELVTAEVVTPPWWHRLMFWRRKRKVMAAGTRPGQPGARVSTGKRPKTQYRKVRNVLGVAMIVISLVFLFVPRCATSSLTRSARRSPQPSSGSTG